MGGGGGGDACRSRAAQAQSKAHAAVPSMQERYTRRQEAASGLPRDLPACRQAPARPASRGTASGAPPPHCGSAVQRTAVARPRRRSHLRVCVEVFHKAKPVDDQAGPVPAHTRKPRGGTTRCRASSMGHHAQRADGLARHARAALLLWRCKGIRQVESNANTRDSSMSPFGPCPYAWDRRSASRRAASGVSCPASRTCLCTSCTAPPPAWRACGGLQRWPCCQSNRLHGRCRVRT